MRVSHKKFLLLISGVLVLAYGFWQARDFLRGPRVYLESPAEGEVFDQSILTVRGQAFDVSKFTLDGRTIFTDEAGRFEEKILLAPGINYLGLYAEDKFGHKKKIERTVLLK